MAVTRGRVVPAVVWGVVAIAVAILAWLLFGLSEESAERGAGLLLLAAALLAAGTAVAVITARRPRPLSLAVSAALMLAGVAAALILAADGDTFTADLMWVAGVPIVGGVITGLLAPPRTDPKA